MLIFIAYQFVFLLVFLSMLPHLFRKGIIGKKGFSERLGYYNIKSSAQKTIWLHAASMGELKVIAALIPLLKQKFGDARFIVTTITQTGKCRAIKLSLDVEIAYLPFDFRSTIRRAFSRVKPDMLILAETELWPMLIYEAKQSGATVLIVNGRLSTKSYRYYKLFRFFFRIVLQKVDFIMAQTPEDAARFVQLGATANRVEVFGNIKFDQLANTVPNAPADEFMPFISQNGKFVFIAGSVREKEIPQIVKAVRDAKNKISKLKTIIAPRHMKSIGHLVEGLNQSGLKAIRRSQLVNIDSKEKIPDILILDSMGELSDLYGHAHLAFVGGSLVPIGGHDPLEPASAGCAVCFGPHMENSGRFAKLLIDCGGARQVDDGQSLSRLIVALANEPTLAKSMGQKAKTLIAEQSGVSEKIVVKLSEFL